MDDVKRAVMLLAIGDDSHPPQVSPAGYHGELADIELGGVGDLACRNINFYGVVDIHDGVGVADGSAVMGDTKRDSFLSQLYFSHFSEFVLEEESENSSVRWPRLCCCHSNWVLVQQGPTYLGFLWSDSVDGETPLHVVHQAEILSSLLNSDYIYR